MARHRWATASRNRSVDRLDRILTGSTGVQSSARVSEEGGSGPAIHFVEDEYPTGEFVTGESPEHRDAFGWLHKGNPEDAGALDDALDDAGFGAAASLGADAAPLRTRRRWVAARRGALLVAGCALVIGIWAAAGVERGDGMVVPVGSGADMAGQANGADGNVRGDGGGGPEAAAEPAAEAPKAEAQETASGVGKDTQSSESSNPPGGARLIVHVAGAVASPGVIEAEAGARVFEVVELAGGALPEAQLSAVNLAAAVQDGQQIVVPRVGEVVPPAAGPGGTVPPAASVPAPPSGAGLVNVNTAAAIELEELPRVGPVLAARIVQWRSDHGAFASPEDLDAVPGIGPAMLEALLPLVTV